MTQRAGMHSLNMRAPLDCPHMAPRALSRQIPTRIVRLLNLLPETLNKVFNLSLSFCINAKDTVFSSES